MILYLKGCTFPIISLIVSQIIGMNTRSSQLVLFFNQCSASISAVRLVAFKSANIGRLEAFTAGEWGTVCLNGWTKENGAVACRELGFPGLKFLLPGHNYVPSGDGKVAYNALGCYGNEDHLSKCVSNFGESCQHYMDMGIVCNKSNFLFIFNESFSNVIKWISVLADF